MAPQHDLRPRGDRHRGSKLTSNAVVEIRRLYFDENYTMARLADIYGVSTKSIANVNTVARQTAQGAAQTQSASQELAELAEQLSKTVGQFKID